VDGADTRLQRGALRNLPARPDTYLHRRRLSARWRGADPFMGAGTTALVAKELGRNYVGIELNEEYVRIAEERLAECACVSEKG